MDQVHRVVHRSGPQRWSMDPGPCFVYLQIDQICHFEPYRPPSKQSQLSEVDLHLLGFKFRFDSQQYFTIYQLHCTFYHFESVTVLAFNAALDHIAFNINIK